MRIKKGKLFFAIFCYLPSTYISYILDSQSAFSCYLYNPSFVESCVVHMKFRLFLLEFQIMVTFMTLKNSKLVMVKFIWQLLFWHSYRRLLSQKRKSASWDISYTLKERRISVPSKGRKKIVQNIKTYLFLIWFVFYPLYSRNTKKLKKLKSWIFYKQWYFSQIV